MRYLEDLAPGQRFSSGPVTVDEAEIVAFAERYDPQPFHLNHAAAAKSMFGGLAASGWMTAALTMRMQVTGGLDLAWGMIGRNIEQMEWPRPVRPGDVLRAESEVLEVKPSASRPDRGTVRVRTQTLNQNGEVVQSMIGNLVVPRRPETNAGG